jgi:hypothetical protein
MMQMPATKCINTATQKLLFFNSSSGFTLFTQLGLSYISNTKDYLRSICSIRIKQQLFINTDILVQTTNNTYCSAKQFNVTEQKPQQLKILVVTRYGKLED